MKLQGPVRALLGGGAAAGPVDLTLPGDATLGELLDRLAERWGGRFREAVAAGGAELPARLRVFVDGELAASPAQLLPARADSPAQVTVVVLAPMMGGGW